MKELKILAIKKLTEMVKSGAVDADKMLALIEIIKLDTDISS